MPWLVYLVLIEVHALMRLLAMLSVGSAGSEVKLRCSGSVDCVQYLEQTCRTGSGKAFMQELFSSSL